MTIESAWARASLLGALALAAAVSASADEIQYALQGGVNYSDNVERQPTNEQDSAAAVAGIELIGERTTGRFRYDVEAHWAYFDYFESDVPDQDYGRILAFSSYDFVPERLQWTLAGSFDQGRPDLLRPETPRNIEDVITLATGPVLRLNLSEAMEALVEGHYVVADYSERDFDNDTIGGSVVIGRRLAERSLIGIGGSYDEVSYDTATSPTTPDFDRSEAFLRLNLVGSRTTIDADIGYAKIEGEGFDDSGLMVRLEAERQLTPYVSAFIGYIQEYPTSEGGALAEGARGITSDASVLTAGPREAKSSTVGFRMDRPRTAAQIAYARREESVLLDPASRDYNEVRGFASRMLSARSSVRILAAYAWEDFSAAEDYDEFSVGAAMNVALGRMLSLDVQVEHRERDSDLFTNTYSELSGGIFLRYGTANAAGF